MKVIVNLSSSPAGALQYQSEMGPEVCLLTKGDFSKSNIVQSISRLRKSVVEEIHFYCTNRKHQYNLLALQLIAILGGAKRSFLKDSSGDSELFRQGSLVREVTDAVISVPYVIFVIFVVPLLYLLSAGAVACGAAPCKRRNDVKGSLCYLRTDFWFDIQAGGSLTHTRGFVNGGIESGHDIKILSVDPLRHYGLKTNVTVIKPSRLLRYFPVRIAQLEYNLRLLIVASRFVRIHRPQAFYQRLSTSNFAGVMLALVWRAPLILELNTSSTWAERHWRGRSGWWLEWLCERLNTSGAYRIAVVSAQLRRTVVAKGVRSEKIIVNPNGVDTVQFNDTVDSSNLTSLNVSGQEWVGFAGMFSQWHGVLTLCRCVKHVVQKRPNVQFLILGDGALKKEMLRILREDNVEDHVTFAGVVKPEAVPAFLNTCRVLVSPHEHMANGDIFFGSPTKIFEYMAMAKGIVASHVGQLAELLEDHREALLVEPGDADQLAQAIVNLLANPELCRELGRRAREKVIADYTWKRNFVRIAEPLGL